ncbi:hypothetical protein [Hydrotalea sp.]|uniref:hypothetical protein n=1 Tax=Hydrotalea sp. TaxID=2881279 RepID=UPI003D1137FE
MMKKTITLLVAAFLVVNGLVAQSMADGINDLNSSFKVQSAIDILKKIYDSKPKDPQAIYWYGQALIGGNDVTKTQMEAAKAVYQKALTDGVNEPLIWVGAAHIDLLEGGDLNAAKQKFEQAITATTPTKGRHKGEPSVEILEAIGRANADGGSKVGDPQYGIDKLKQAAALDPKNSMVYIYMGICYLKLGGENGGEAVKAFEQAATIDPKNVLAYYRIGMVYLSQNNEDALMPAFGKAIDADPTFPDTYLALFEFYKNKNVDMAKTNLDKFIKYADKDPQNDFYLADYLYQAGKYQESLAKEKEIQQSLGGTTNQLPGLNLLYAYNYYKLGDSIQAKQNIDTYFKLEPTDKVKPADYELAVKIYSKFPESATDAVKYIDAAIQSDTSKVNKINYMTQAADLFAKAKNYKEQLNWLLKAQALKGTWSEYDYYNISNVAYQAADYPKVMEVAANYIKAFPDKPQGYYFNVMAAKALDTTTNPGIAIPALQQQIDYLMKDSVKNQRFIVIDYYYMMGYYNDRAKDYAKALDVCDKILALIPNDPDMLKIRSVIEKNMKDNLKFQKSATDSSGSKDAAAAGGTKN